MRMQAIGANTLDGAVSLSTALYKHCAGQALDVTSRGHVRDICNWWLIAETETRHGRFRRRRRRRGTQRPRRRDPPLEPRLVGRGDRAGGRARRRGQDPRSDLAWLPPRPLRDEPLLVRGIA